MAVTLTVGQKYSRDDLGIKFPRSFLGREEIDGEGYLFINIGGRYHNEWDETLYRAIHEPSGLKEVVKQDTKPTETNYVFIRDLFWNEEKFTYKGILDVIKPHDPKRNHLAVIK